MPVAGKSRLLAVLAANELAARKLLLRNSASCRFRSHVEPAAIAAKLPDRFEWSANRVRNLRAIICVKRRRAMRLVDV
jgi:hypothetical protein